MKFYFYKVTTAGDESFVDALQTAAERADRVIELSDAHVMLHQLSKRAPWIGHLVRIRMKPIPSRASIRGLLGDLGLMDDEGLGEHTVFYYDEDTEILVMSSTQAGVSPSAFCTYLAQAADVDASFSYIPDFAGLDEVEQLARITRFEMALAGFSGSVTIPGLPPTVESVLKAQAAFRAPVLHLEFSVGANWRTETLEPSLVKRAARAIYRATEQVEVRTLKVDGRTSRQDQQIIDLMRGRLNAVVRIKGDGRKISTTAAASAARQAWEVHSEKLTELYLGAGT